MPSKGDSNTTDVPMGLKKNSKESGETNNNEVQYDQHTTAQKKQFYTWKSKL